MRGLVSETRLIFGFGGKHQFNSYLIVTLPLPVKPQTLINTHIQAQTQTHTQTHTQEHKYTLQLTLLEKAHEKFG